MTTPDRMREIFSRARDKTTPAEREKYLSEICRDDPGLRREVESLLQADEDAGSFLDRTREFSADTVGPERIGMMVGRYKLLQEIGSGGFGVVYMAEQVEPVQRKVALKIIKAGMDTREVIARFEAERQALALMDHPNIARVLDAGATEAGRPFFVIELVRGNPITDYCDQNNLCSRDRLLLFIKVCRAVQHAHQKGIIHRDLKPSNVLVTLHDGEPVPKVIDFGVAKALGQKLTEKTLFTGFHDLIGTPAYMSPEQAEMSGLDIDTRSDIYALGVLLYELLTGATPFDTDTFRRAALDEIRRIIRESEPPRPSTRLRTLGDKLPGVASRRRIDPAALTRLVRGDLDWIVMKALEKDRRRRYETPDAFANDVVRHLNNEPVIAAAPSSLYTLRKFIRRHQAGLAVAGAFLVLLIAGAAVSTWQAVRATRAERAQAVLRAEAEQARANETKLRILAEAREKIAQASLLAHSGDPTGAEEAMSSVPPLIVQLDPDNAAAAYLSVGAWRAHQGQWKEAIADFTKVIEAQPAGFEGYHALAPALAQIGDSLGYGQLRRAMLRRFGGTKDPLLADRLIKDCLIRPWLPAPLDSLARLADMAVQEGPDHKAWRRFQFAKGLVEYRRGHFADAVNFVREVAEGGEWNRDPNRDVQAYMVLAMAYAGLNQTAYARSALTTGLALTKDGLPQSDRDLGGWPAWNEWIIARSLVSEARGRIEGASSAGSSPDLLGAMPPSGSSARMSPEQQRRAALLKARGTRASLTILPVRLAGQPIGQLTAVVGALLEQAGLETVELGTSPFDPGSETGLGRVATVLGAFVKAHPLATEYGLYAEYNGIPANGINEVRAILVDRQGEVVWTERQTPQDDPFRKIEGPDPMSVSVFLVGRLSPHLGLNDQTRAAAKPSRIMRLLEEQSGLTPESERQPLPERQKEMKRARGTLTLALLPVRIGGAADTASATALARLMNEAGVCRAVPASSAVLLQTPPETPNELKTLWDLARAVREYARANPPDADYLLYADYVFNPQQWQSGHVHFVVCDRQGEWVIVDMQNSDQEDYQSIKPTSKEACSRLLVKRMEGYLR
jgi:eukaryotic-like serine/threonine-protein kinase